MKVLMLGPARSVNGGVSAVVNNYYNAGLDKNVDLQYIGTMEDGSKVYKLFVAVKALGEFMIKVSRCEVVHIHMASDVSIYRKIPFIWLSKIFGKKLVTFSVNSPCSVEWLNTSFQLSWIDNLIRMSTPSFSDNNLEIKYLLRAANKMGEGNGTPLLYSCLENPMDGGAW